jgi:hypothetical protein
MTLILGVVLDIHFALLLLADKLGILQKSIAIKCVEFAGGTGELAKAFITCAEKEDLIERIPGEPSAAGKFRRVYNVITNKGKQLLRSQLL